MSNITIFKNDIPAAHRGDGMSELAKSLASTGSSNVNRRIVARKGAFRKIVNGEEVGKHKGDALGVVIVNALPKVSRQFYAQAYDPNGTPTLPDCWSNLGDVPDAKANNPQAASCTTCPQNVSGSGGGTRRACAFQRRIAIILVSPNPDGSDPYASVDPYGEVYQMNIASTSLFGKGDGNTHPFESYLNYLSANNESIDRIVTEISFDDNSDTNTLLFTPVRHLTPEEEDIARSAGSSAAAKNAVAFTVAAQDGVKKLPPQPVVEEAFAPTSEEVIEEPTKRAQPKANVPPPAAKKNLADVVSAWGDDD